MEGWRERIAKALAEGGLRRSDELAALAEGAVALEIVGSRDPTAPALGASRIGGTPDTSASFVWPTWRGVPLAFLAQLDLARLRDVLPTDLLPSEGRLLFFYEHSQGVWGFDPADRGAWRVFHDTTPAESLVRASWPAALPAEGRFDPAILKASARWTLPGWESLQIEGLGLSDDEIDVYCEVFEEIVEGYPQPTLHQVLGHPQPVQSDMSIECQMAANGVYMGDSSARNTPRWRELESGADEWTLLLQLDSEEHVGMVWGDLGMLYFCARRSDLRARQYDDVWMVLQCT